MYFDGDLKKISWVILTEGKKFAQNRTHIEKYKDKISKIQSKYVALHIALFWGIGTFKIKNGDCVKIRLDEEIMQDQLSSKIKIEKGPKIEAYPQSKLPIWGAQKSGSSDSLLTRRAARRARPGASTS